MSEHTHTPGPWVVNQPYATAKTKRLSVVAPAGDAELGNWMVAAEVMWPEDARLIAASPKLYEACRMIVAATSYEEIQEAKAKADEAIAEVELP